MTTPSSRWRPRMRRVGVVRLTARPDRRGDRRGPGGRDSDVQFGLPVGSLDGTRAAVVEAPCSDRQLVSGRAVVVDLATDARRDIEIEDADLTWLGWRTNGGLAYTMLRRGDTVFGEIDAGPASAPRRGPRPRAWARGRRTRPSSARTDSRSSDRVRSSAEVAIVQQGADGTVASFRHEGHDRARGLIGRAERSPGRRPMVSDRRIPARPCRPGTASADPAYTRRAGLVLRGVVPEAVPRLARSARVRDADAEPAWFHGARPGVPGGRDRRHGRGRRPR